MKYCMNCGRQLPDTAKFCGGCGARVEDLEPPSNNTGRRIEYAGTVYKCPNCGEVLDSMTAICPACGYEIRNVKAASSVQSFAEQLAKIEAEEMPVNDSDSLMRKVFGRDLRETPKRLQEARTIFVRQKLGKKINLISNFPIPNTKEDLTEFALLVTSNLEDDSDSLMHAVWERKLEQIYRKAQILIPTDPVFGKIEEAYIKGKRKAKMEKMLPIYQFGGLFAFILLLWGFVYQPVLTLVILGLILLLTIVCIILKKNHSKRRY